jgi:hypothetical protein
LLLVVQVGGDIGFVVLKTVKTYVGETLQEKVFLPIFFKAVYEMCYGVVHKSSKKMLQSRMLEKTPNERI